MNEGHFDEKFVKTYSNLVYTAIHRRLKGYGIVLPHEEILDIQQDVFISIWEDGKLATIRDSESIPYWIAIVSGNAAMQYVRKLRRSGPEGHLLLSDKLEESCLNYDLLSSLTYFGLSPSEEFDKNELSGKIDEAIESLPVKERLIIKLNLLHDKKYEEIAGILGVPVGTVSNSIKRAKDKLRTYLNGFR
jgi:RNA polymerase sigma-70 factor (ECF subfamily)